MKLQEFVVICCKNAYRGNQRWFKMTGQLGETGSLIHRGPLDSLYMQGPYHRVCHLLLSLILCYIFFFSPSLCMKSHGIKLRSNVTKTEQISKTHSVNPKLVFVLSTLLLVLAKNQCSCQQKRQGVCVLLLIATVQRNK